MPAVNNPTELLDRLQTFEMPRLGRAVHRGDQTEVRSGAGIEFVDGGLFEEVLEHSEVPLAGGELNHITHHPRHGHVGVGPVFFHQMLYLPRV